MGELIKVLFMVVFKTFPVLLIFFFIYAVAVIIIKSRKQIKATGKVALRRSKDYCINSSIINNIQKEVKRFSEEVNTELKTQIQNESASNSNQSKFNRQQDKVLSSHLNEHIFNIKCCYCGYQNEIGITTIKYFPNCMCCKKPMLDMSNYKHRASIINYVIANQQGINHVVYSKLRAILTS